MGGDKVQRRHKESSARQVEVQGSCLWPTAQTLSDCGQTWGVSTTAQSLYAPSVVLSVTVWVAISEATVVTGLSACWPAISLGQGRGPRVLSR